MKKNIKGFTIIEIVVSLVIIILIATISIVTINKTSKKDTRETKLYASADVYYETNKYIRSCVDIPINDLITNGYVEESLYNNQKYKNDHGYKYLNISIDTNGNKDYSIVDDNTQCVSFTYDLGYDTENKKTTDYFKKGEKISLRGEYVRDGYTFDGWVDETDGKSYSANEEITITKNVELKADWKNKGASVIPNPESDPEPDSSNENKKCTVYYLNGFVNNEEGYGDLPKYDFYPDKNDDTPLTLISGLDNSGKNEIVEEGIYTSFTVSYKNPLGDDKVKIAYGYKKEYEKDENGNCNNIHVLNARSHDDWSEIDYWVDINYLSLLQEFESYSNVTLNEQIKYSLRERYSKAFYLGGYDEKNYIRTNEASNYENKLNNIFYNTSIDSNYNINMEDNDTIILIPYHWYRIVRYNIDNHDGWTGYNVSSEDKKFMNSSNDFFIDPYAYLCNECAVIAKEDFVSTDCKENENYECVYTGVDNKGDYYGPDYYGTLCDINTEYEANFGGFEARKIDYLTGQYSYIDDENYYFYDYNSYTRQGCNTSYYPNRYCPYEDSISLKTELDDYEYSRLVEPNYYNIVLQPYLDEEQTGYSCGLRLGWEGKTQSVSVKRKGESKFTKINVTGNSYNDLEEGDTIRVASYIKSIAGNDSGMAFSKSCRDIFTSMTSTTEGSLHWPVWTLTYTGGSGDCYLYIDEADIGDGPCTDQACDGDWDFNGSDWEWHP